MPPIDAGGRAWYGGGMSTPPPASSPAPAGDAGWLALVATPIGNLEDITLRALRTLREADLVAAEDTRHARILLDAHGIRTALTPYHAFNEHRRTEALLDQVAAGKKVALLSDAGTPAVSDPGFFIVRAAVARGIEPVVLPGPSALTFSVVAAGLPVDRFRFLGFLPVKSGRRRTALATVATTGETTFFFESPHRIGRLLEEIRDVLGPDTRVAVIREATKLHEERLRGTAAELLQLTAGRTWRGELVVAVAPPANGAGPAAEAADSAEAETLRDE